MINPELLEEIKKRMDSVIAVHTAKPEEYNKALDDFFGFIHDTLLPDNYIIVLEIIHYLTSNVKIPVSNSISPNHLKIFSNIAKHHREFFQSPTGDLLLKDSPIKSFLVDVKANGYKTLGYKVNV